MGAMKKNTKSFSGVDFRKRPFRGIITETAREMGISTMTLHNRRIDGDADVLLRLAEKIEAVKRKHSAARNRFERAIAA